MSNEESSNAAHDDHASQTSSAMFRPPINRSMRVLDRAFFRKEVSLVAVNVHDPKQIHRLRKVLSKDLLQDFRIGAVVNVPRAESRSGKAILLRPEIQLSQPSTWSAALVDQIKKEAVALSPFQLQLDYDHWTFHDILSAILPEETHNEVPSGFSIIGHVAHLNLRHEYLPYKNLIGTILLDKDSKLRTVINKIEDVGASNEYRTFNFEYLAGDQDMNVEVIEEGNVFRFDYSKVYWNSRLNTEHARLVSHFQPGEAVCDVMAGVGPFAIPAGRKKCWVLANDLNPDSYKAMHDAVSRNKVDKYVQPFNEDGRVFIRKASTRLLTEPVSLDVTPPAPRRKQNAPPSVRPARQIIHRPKHFSHYVLNLPASALTFLDSFVGLYHGLDEAAVTKLPMVHVYFFHSQVEDIAAVAADVCQEISSLIRHKVTPGDSAEEGKVAVHDVRNVAPNKSMFCASFRLPREVAFAAQLS